MARPSALELARSGLNIFGIHFDRRQNMPAVEQVMNQIRETGREVLFFNINAADAGKRNDALNQMQEHWKRIGGERHFVKFCFTRWLSARSNHTLVRRWKKN